MSISDKHLGTAIKVLSIRRENIYRSLQMQQPGTERWRHFNGEIDDLTNAINALETERESLRRGEASVA